MSKPIRQTVTFKATPHEIYEMLMDSHKHAQFSQSAASISRKVGGKFSAYDRYITGTNIESRGCPTEYQIIFLRCNIEHPSSVFHSLRHIAPGQSLRGSEKGDYTRQTAKFLFVHDDHPSPSLSIRANPRQTA